MHSRENRIQKLYEIGMVISVDFFRLCLEQGLELREGKL